VEHSSALRVLAGHLSDVHCARFHPNVHYIATGSADRSVRLWELRAGSCTRVLK
jgi:transcription initiation factor TFIID subunit 5